MNMIALDEPKIRIPEAIYSPGLEGIIVGETSISHVEGDLARLSYRGILIEDVIALEYLEVAYLVLFGQLPGEIELTNFESYMTEHGRLSAGEIRLIESFPKTLHPMRILQAAIAAISYSDAQYAGVSAECSEGLQIIAKMPMIIAAIRAARENVADVSLYNEGHDYLSRFLNMCCTERFSGNVQSDSRALEIFKTVQLLQMDHSFNAGTFSARVIGSTLASVPAVLSGAIGALSGVLHGGADEAALRAARGVASPENALRFVDELLVNKGRLMGMGHREYRRVDPRSKILKPLAEELCTGSRLENDFNTLVAIEMAFNTRMRERGKEVWANLEFYKGVVYEALGIEKEFFTATFALSRSVGWLAHLLVSRQNNKIIRPAAHYIGHLPQ